jgi:prepilin-type N-terminal cleavage/methylation domain-containing protein
MSRVFGRLAVRRSAVRRRRGFTLVELLVVIAIIGTLVALLMPAVQAARESARKMSCGNNLHNIALAVQNYHDSVGSFPTCWFYQKSDPDFFESWGWGALVLPFIEQKNLHDQLGVTTGRLSTQLDPSLNPGGAAAASRVKTGVQTPLQIFICPSDSGFNGRGLSVNRSFAQGLGSGKVGLTDTSLSNYPGVAGHRDVHSSTMTANRGIGSGVFFENSYMRMSDIIDGTSNTFMIGERESLECKSGTWVGVERPTGSGAAGPNQVLGHSRPKLNQATSVIAWNTGGTGCMEGFSSLHPGGAQFAACDGSVRFVANQINWNWIDDTLEGHKKKDANGNPIGVYQRLMSRNDKVPVGDF